MASAFKRAQQIHRSRTWLNCCQTEKEPYFEFWIRKVLEKSWWTCGISTDMRSATWDLCWPLQGWEHLKYDLSEDWRFFSKEVKAYEQIFQEIESVWANSSDIPSINFSPQSLELMRAWVVDTGLVPQVDVTKLLPSTIEERIFLNCELIFYPFWKSRLKEVMIQRATILGEYSPLQETGRIIKLTSIWKTVKYYRKKNMNKQNKGDGQIFFCEWQSGEVAANSVTYL